MQDYRMDTWQQEIGELGAGIRKEYVNMKGWRVVWGVCLHLGRFGVADAIG